MIARILNLLQNFPAKASNDDNRSRLAAVRQERAAQLATKQFTDDLEFMLWIVEGS